MGFFGRLWSRAVKASGQRPNYAARYTTRVPGSGIVRIPPQAEMDYARLVGDPRDNGLVSICLKWIRRNVTQGQLRLGTFDEHTNEWTPYDGNHPALAVLRRPNPLWSRDMILGAVSDEIGLEANGYLVKARDQGGNGIVRELYWIPNGFVQVEPNHADNPARPVLQYWIRNAGAIWEPWRPEDVIHFRDGVDPSFPWMGWSAVKRQLRSLAAMNAGEGYTASTLRHGHAGKALVPREPVMAARASGGGGGGDESPDEIELRAERDRLVRQATGENAGRLAIATLPLDLLELGNGPEEMLLDRVLDRPEAMIVAAFGLNTLVLDLPSSAATRTYSNKAEARRDAWETAIIPLQDQIADVLTSQFLRVTDEWGRTIGEWGETPEELGFYWDRRHVAALREDANERTNRATALFSATLFNRNRSLQENGFDPIAGPEGEQYYGDPSPEQARREAEAQQQMAQQQAMMAAQQPGQPMPGEPTPGPEDEPGMMAQPDPDEPLRQSIRAVLSRKGAIPPVDPADPLGLAQQAFDRWRTRKQPRKAVVNG